jgi:hypothetical protein
MTTLDIMGALRELDSPWLDAKAAASYLRISEKQFRERVSVQPGFPSARDRAGLRLLWLRRELDAWLDLGVR